MKTMDAWIQYVDADLFSTKKRLSAFPPVFAFEVGRPIYQELMSLLEEERKNERESNIPALKPSLVEIEVLDQPALHDLKASSAEVEPSTFKGCQSESEDELLQCGHCFREFPRKSYLKMHIQGHFERESKIPALKPSPMEIEVLDQPALHDLKASSVEVEPSTFKGCQSESEDELLQCGHCFREFPRKSYLKMHIQGHFSTKNNSEYICKKEHCGKTFTTSESLEFHSLEHDEKNSDECCTNCTERSNTDSFKGCPRMLDIEHSYANTFQRDLYNFVKETLQNDDAWLNWK